MPSKTRLIEEVPTVHFEKGLFRVSYGSGRTDAWRPHDFMVGVRVAQSAIEEWFANGQQEIVDLPGAARVVHTQGESC